MTFQIEWIRRGGPPKVKPNPDYPNGIDLDVTQGRKPNCKVDLPYPPQQTDIGLFLIKCDVCGYTAACTTAARPDDPRSIRIPCLVRANDNSRGY